jgi:glycosyltransferase involved in cell wall biosynthesis
VLEQAYPALDYLVIDGGSTDDSVSVIRQYESRLTFWCSEPDGGQAAALNTGFARSQAEILGWVNSDDLLLPGALSAVAEYFAAHPDEEWLVGGCITIDSLNTRVRGRFGIRPGFNRGSRVTFRKLLIYGCDFNQPSVFWRRSAHLAVGQFDTSLRFSFDREFFLRLAKRKPSGRIPQPLSCFRLHSAAKSTTMRQTKHEDDAAIGRQYRLQEMFALSMHTLRLGLRAIDLATQVNDNLALLLHRISLPSTPSGPDAGVRM